MIRHEPPGYACPFCGFQRGAFNEHNAAADLVGDNAGAFALLSPKWYPRNPGAVLVMPREHHENLYALPTEVGHAVWDLTRDVATAMRTVYDCEGVTIRQHNEPAGHQDVWHLHVHVIPRTPMDGLYGRDTESRWASADERRPFADTLRVALDPCVRFVE